MRNFTTMIRKMRGRNRGSTRGKRWCPVGCGKKVIMLGSKQGYECEKCGQWWRTKKDLEESWKDDKENI